MSYNPPSADEVISASESSDPDDQFLAALQTLPASERFSDRNPKEEQVVLHRPPEPNGSKFVESVGAEKKRRRKQPKQDLAKLERRIIVGWILGGLIGGGVGAAIWTVGGNYTGYEFGFLAWGVGALAGIGLHVSGQGYGESRSGWIAVAIALFSIVIGRFAIFWSFTGSAIDALDIALGFFVDPLGVLWGGLARFTAYRIGSGSQFD